MTTEEFIQKATAVHGDKYDYSKVEYVNAHAKVCIICHEHGDFMQVPNSHLRGIGCSKCGKERMADSRRRTKEWFLEKAKQVHGDKYDYSKIQYSNLKTKICIVCPEHGEFWQQPNAHLDGQGCPQCGAIKIREKRAYSFTDFLSLAKKKHGDRYDYSKANYVNYKTKICIVCPEHGEFWQKPTDHVQGQGCPYCAGHVTSTSDDFIRKAREVHGDKYDYSKVVYKNNKTKVCIICPEHGEFWQVPNSHLRGSSCPKCARKMCSQAIKDTLQDFIRKAREVHGDKYDYSKVNYINSGTEVCIICSKHGEFWQKPVNHIQGSGCLPWS